MTYSIHQSPFIRADLYDQIDELALSVANDVERELDRLSISLSDDRKETIYETVKQSIIDEILE